MSAPTQIEREHYARPVSVPKSAPFGVFTHAESACPQFFGCGITYNDEYGATGRDYPGGLHASSSCNPFVIPGARTIRPIR